MGRVFGRKPGLFVSVSSAYDVAVFLLQEWPNETGPKHLRQILLKCLEGGCAPAVALVAFVEGSQRSRHFMESEPLRTGGQARPQVGQAQSR